MAMEKSVYLSIMIDTKATIVGVVSAVSPTKPEPKPKSIIQLRRLQFPKHAV